MASTCGTPSAHGFHHTSGLRSWPDSIYCARPAAHVERGERSVDAFQVEFDIASAGDRLDWLGHLDAQDRSSGTCTREFGFPPADPSVVDSMSMDFHTNHEISARLTPDICFRLVTHIGRCLRHERDNLFLHPVTLGAPSSKGAIVELVDHQRPCFPHCPKRRRLTFRTDSRCSHCAPSSIVTAAYQKPTEPPRPHGACGRDIAECVKSEAQQFVTFAPPSGNGSTGRKSKFRALSQAACPFTRQGRRRLARGMMP